MKITETIILNEKQKLAVFKLWNEEYPERLNHQKISELDDYFSNLTDQNTFS